MATMDIFSQNAFKTFELTRGLEDVPYKPGLVSSLNLFNFIPIRQRHFGIEKRAGVLTLIPFSAPDGPATQNNMAGTERDIRDFRTRHFKKQDVIRASEVAGIREFATESELMQVQKEVARRAAKLRAEAELTFEYHRLNALQGLVKDPKDGATIYNWYTEFGIDAADEIDFDLDNASPASGALNRKCLELVESLEESLGGLIPGGVQVEALCSNSFWNYLTTHKEVREAYKYAGNIAAQQGIELVVFFWGGITWRRYRGTTAVGVTTDKCILYVSGIDGLFEQYASPTEDFEFVNTPGQPVYYRTIPDRDRNQFVTLELEANPMFVCTRPQALRKGRYT
jgi:hypothetical protein